jgi:hypothetical protein
MFGRGVIAFNPSSLDWVAPDGHEEILNHVEYRADGARVVVLSRDPGAVPALAFGFPSEDVAVAAGFNCTMNRVGSTTAASTASPTGVHSRLGPLGAAPAGPPNATLSVLAGVSAPGMLTPFENATLYLTTEDPAAALARAGFGGTNPYADWLAACRQKRDGCMAGMNAMTSSSVGTIQLDAAGKGQTPALPSGQYFVLGFAPYQGRSLIWHRPYFLRPGANNLILDQTDGTSG